jgi:uncharacterized repeat protein (TIGR02543 family)
MTLTAKWELIEYTITYNLDGGTITNAPESYTIHSEGFTLPIPTKEHYLFLGWTYAGQTTPVRTVTISAGEIGDRTYTANYRIQTHTVTFITNGAGEMDAITVEYGSLLTEPEVLLLDEPTRGIDVGAKYEIYQLIIALAERGKMVIMVSSEMPELFGVCDRILVMSGGRLAGEVEPKKSSQEEVMSLAAKYV